MTDTTHQFRVIANRRQTIDADIDKLRKQILELEAENSELEIAAKVLSRLGLLSDNATPELPLSDSNEGEKTTIVQKIKNIVVELEAAGIKGVSGGQILTEMTKRWSISDPNVVRPTLWRMVKGNTLIKKNELYSVVAHNPPFGGLRP